MRRRTTPSSASAGRATGSGHGVCPRCRRETDRLVDPRGGWMVCVRCGLAVDRQKGPLPGRSLFLDIAGLDVQARKNILRVLRDARERERSLSMEVERLRAALFHQRRATGLLGRLRERLHGKDRAVA